MPILDKLLLKNPIRLWLSRIGLLNATSPVVTFAQQRMKSRIGTTQDKPETGDSLSGRDFLSRFMQAGQKDPEFMNPQRVLSLTVANMFAGSDTTAISLRSIFYHLLKNPETLKRLRKELDDAGADGLFVDARLVRWEESQKLPYLNAVIKEALRIFPAAGLPLERIVPPGGVQLCGRFIPAGTVVGCSAWLIHRNQAVFGPDSDIFRPERWLEGTEKAKSDMNACLFTFGAGARTCVGKNISYLEMYKLVPALLRTFEVSTLG
jgi:cytochrome P450